MGVASDAMPCTLKKRQASHFEVHPLSGKVRFNSLGHDWLLAVLVLVISLSSEKTIPFPEKSR